MSFELRALVRRVEASMIEADLDQLAEAVFDAIDEEDRGAALKAALRPYVQTFVGQIRSDRRTGSPLLPPRSLPPSIPAEPRAVSPHRTHDGYPTPSARWARVREEAWRARLRDNIAIDPRGEVRKFLGDFTELDCRAVASMRDAEMTKLAISRDEFLALADALAVDDGAKVITDLPDPILARLLDRKSAA